ncbi:D-alanyl-D-alanine carboxypeptidase family protein [Skermanella stibiiresistens]|uniref:D-alanyl-D-alanine carboxypeptidase family protein n=1 Tax=Skermanella stibiiresistens TaxID=913326 RepID=UPI0004BBE6FB|nr:D-alanyl-D-alanine carboxypeptidase family protein [Skermanella stibiiresistens]
MIRTGALAALLLSSPIAAGPAAAYRASLVIDADSGVVLHAEQPNLRSFPASTTKMMTVYMAFDALRTGKLRLDEDLPISVRAASQTGQSLRLRQGATIKARDAILGSIIESANDAAVVLAERLGGTESDFAEAMTAKARALGMNRTEFRNASGLNHPEQVVTARDMALLALALQRQFPDYYSYFSTRSFSHRGSTFNSVNGFLVNYKGADGIKTGFTCAAGYNLVASAVRDGRRLVAVVLGEQSRGDRAESIARLMDAAYDNPTPKIAATLHDIDPVRTREPDPPAVGVISPACASIVSVPGALRPDGGWSIEIAGAFPTKSKAAEAGRKLMRTHSAVMGGAMMTTIERARKHRPIVIGLAEEQATATCRKLRQAKAYCVVVTPRNLKAAVTLTAAQAGKGISRKSTAKLPGKPVPIKPKAKSPAKSK